LGCITGGWRRRGADGATGDAAGNSAGDAADVGGAPRSIMFANPNMSVKKTMNGMATSTHDTALYPLAHSMFKTQVQNKNQMIFKAKM
jgi:hypothetical protein